MHRNARNFQIHHKIEGWRRMHQSKPEAAGRGHQSKCSLELAQRPAGQWPVLCLQKWDTRIHVFHGKCGHSKCLVIGLDCVKTWCHGGVLGCILKCHGGFPTESLVYLDSPASCSVPAKVSIPQCA
jgi:hypothetical protein